MSTPPNVVHHPRHDLLVTGADGRPKRHTVYSGRMYFGPPAQRGAMMSRMEFTGVMYLPDGLPYVGAQLGDAALSGDFWLASVGEYHFVPSAEAQFVDDPREPGLKWIQMAITTQGYSGSIIGYRVTATVAADAVRPPG